MSCGNDVKIIQTTAPTPFDITSGDAVDNVVSGPVTVNSSDEVHFWSAGSLVITAASGASGITINFVGNQLSYGAGAPAVDPDDVTVSNIYYDTTASQLYVWDVVGTTWDSVDTDLNILESDLTATANRTHDVAGFNLDFNDTGTISFDQEADSASNFTIGSWTAGGGSVTEYAAINLTSQKSAVTITSNASDAYLVQNVEDIAGTVRSEVRAHQGLIDLTHWNTSATKMSEVILREGNAYNTHVYSSSGIEFNSNTGIYRFTGVVNDDTETKFLVLDSSNEVQYREFSSIIPTDFSSLVEYDNDTAAGVGGVGSGEFWVTSAGNTIGLPRGVVMRKI